jgi:hypothetical protein
LYNKILPVNKQIMLFGKTLNRTWGFTKVGYYTHIYREKTLKESEVVALSCVEMVRSRLNVAIESIAHRQEQRAMRIRHALENHSVITGPNQ